MDDSVYNLVDKMKRFWLVLRKNPGSMFVCYAIIVFVLCISISLADLTSHNAYDAAMLGNTMLGEIGPYFEKSVEDHIRFLEEYEGYLEDRQLAGILGVLPDRYNPKKSLDDALATLKKAKATGSREESAKAIWQAGEQLVQFQMKAANFPCMRMVLREHPKATKPLLKAIENAINQSRETLTLFEDDPTLGTGYILCESNRLVMRRLFLARTILISQSGNSQELLESFRKIVADTVNAERTYAKDLSKRQKQMSKLFIDSEENRLEVLNALAKGDLQKAYILLCETGRKALHRRQELLLLSKTLLGEQPEKPTS